MGWRSSIRIAAGLLLTIVLASCPDPTLNMREADTAVGPEARPVRSDDQDNEPEEGESLPPLQITWFSFTFPPDAETDRPEIEARGAINHDSREITVTIPAGESRDSLVPTIFHTGTDIDPPLPSEDGLDFSSPVTFTITRPVADAGEDTGDEGTAGEEPEIEEVSYTVTVLVEGGVDEPVFARFFSAVSPGFSSHGIIIGEQFMANSSNIAALTRLAIAARGQDVETGHQIYELFFFDENLDADPEEGSPSGITNIAESTDLEGSEEQEVLLSGSGALIWMRLLSPLPQQGIEPLDWFLDYSSPSFGAYYHHYLWPEGMPVPAARPWDEMEGFPDVDVSVELLQFGSRGYPVSLITHLYITDSITIEDYTGGPFTSESDYFWYWANQEGNLRFNPGTFISLLDFESANDYLYFNFYLHYGDENELDVFFDFSMAD